MQFFRKVPVLQFIPRKGTETETLFFYAILDVLQFIPRKGTETIEKQ